MPTQLFATVLYSVIVSVVGLVSNMFYFKYEKKAKSFLPNLIPFASGILLAGTFLYLLPMALTLHLDALIITLFGFLGYYVLELFIQMNPCSIEIIQTTKNDKTAVFKRPSYFGLCLHTLFQGIMLGVAFDIGFKYGVVVTFFLGMLKITESLATMQYYFQGKVLMKNLILAFLVPIMSITVYFYFTLAKIPLAYNGMLLALTSGIFLYLVTTNLFKRLSSKGTGLLFIIGIVVTVLLGQLI